MSYQIYTTKALILKRIPYDANVSYLLYTKEMGLISALATGVRKSESKLRYALQEYSFCEVSLVKGRHTWRLTSAVLETNLYLSAKEQGAREVIARISTQVIRLVAGQEKDEQLFESLLGGLQELVGAPSELVSAIEILIMLRMLRILGYVSEVEDSVCVPYGLYNEHVLHRITQSKQVFVAHINKGLRESQL
jgi:recombinational DNA repair protein (RecF pathway)